MAAITLNVAHRKDQDRQRRWKTLAGWRDAVFLNNGIQYPATAAAPVPARLQGVDDNHVDTPPTSQAETPQVEFGPLAPDILNAAIPAFFVGRNRAGLWVAREANGRIGGIFVLKNSALRFAQAESAPGGCAVIFPSQGFELDLRNHGNPLAGWLASLTRVATAHLGVIKRFCLGALFVLLAGTATCGIIALKTAIYFSRFGFGTG